MGKETSGTPIFVINGKHYEGLLKPESSNCALSGQNIQPNFQVAVKQDECDTFLTSLVEKNMIDEKLKAAIELALAKGMRVQLKQMKDGSVKAQVIKVEEIKK